MADIKCPNCGGVKWHEGPSGGMSTNILCANKECRHWYNHTGFGELEDLHRVEPSPEEKERIQHRRQQGRDAYLEGRSVDDLRYPQSTANMDRLAGFLDAMAADVRNLATLGRIR